MRAIRPSFQDGWPSRSATPVCSSSARTGNIRAHTCTCAHAHAHTHSHSHADTPVHVHMHTLIYKLSPPHATGVSVRKHHSVTASRLHLRKRLSEQTCWMNGCTTN